MDEDPSCVQRERQTSMPNVGMVTAIVTVSNEVFNLVDPATGTMLELAIVVDGTARHNAKSEVAA